MLNVVEKRSAIRASHRQWSDEFDASPRYFDSITIDPTRSVEAWDRLSENTMAIEIACLPHTLHQALMNTLRKRFGHE